MLAFSMTMTEPTAAEPISFATLVILLVRLTAIHLGDVEDPTTGQPAEVNLEGAQQMIDLLAMLEQKTKGNLTAQEATILERVLFELRMRFVEVQKGQPPSAPKSNIIIP